MKCTVLCMLAFLAIISQAERGMAFCVNSEVGNACFQDLQQYSHSSYHSYYRAPSGPSRDDIERQHFNWGKQYMDAGNWAAAEREFRIAVQYDPKWWGYRFDLAYVLQEQGKDDEAIGQYRASIGLRPSPVAYNNVGIIFYKEGNLDAAEEWYGAALKMDPGYTRARNNLIQAIDYGRKKELSDLFSDAYNLLNKGEYAKAEFMFRKYLLVNPNDAGAWNNLGVALERQGNTLAAEAAYREAVRLAPSDSINTGNLNSLLASSARTSAMNELKAAKEQSENAANAETIEAIKGTAMRCFDDSRGCSYTAGHDEEAVVFAPHETDNGGAKQIPKQLREDPQFRQLESNGEKLDREYKKTYEATQQLWNRIDSGQGDKGAQEVLLAEQRNRLAVLKSEQMVNKIEKQKRYADLGFKP